MLKVQYKKKRLHKGYTFGYTFDYTFVTSETLGISSLREFFLQGYTFCENNVCIFLFYYNIFSSIYNIIFFLL